MRKNNQYTPEFKLQIIKEYLSSEEIGFLTLAKKYNIPSKETVRKWVLKYNQYGEEYFYQEQRGCSQKIPTCDLDSMTLEEQNHYLRMENDILKKAIALNLI